MNSRAAKLNTSQRGNLNLEDSKELLVTQQQQPNHRMTQELRYYTSLGFLEDCLSVFVNHENVQRDTGRPLIDCVCCWGELEAGGQPPDRPCLLVPALSSSRGWLLFSGSMTLYGKHDAVW